jgi:hypothetical protein
MKKYNCWPLFFFAFLGEGGNNYDSGPDFIAECFGRGEKTGFPCVPETFLNAWKKETVFLGSQGKTWVVAPWNFYECSSALQKKNCYM